MLICTDALPSLQRRIFTDTSSDGPTPESKIQQILAIAPILPGQRPEQRSQTPTQQHAQAHPQAQAPPQQAQSSQIDPLLQQAPAPSQHTQASPMNPQFQQGDSQPQPMYTQLQQVQAQPQQISPPFQQGLVQVPQGQAQVQQAPPPAHGTGPSDLIDFGQTSHINAIPAPAPMHQQPIPPLDPPVGLQEPLEPGTGPPIVRLDTNTEEMDVFVDAPAQKH